MRQLIFKKQSPQGLVDGILRVHEKFIFFKYNNSQQYEQVLNEFKKKGLNIEKGKGWIKLDLLGNNEFVKLGEYEIDQKLDTLEQIEEKLFKFYKNKYKELGFYIEDDNKY